MTLSSTLASNIGNQRTSSEGEESSIAAPPAVDSPVQVCCA